LQVSVGGKRNTVDQMMDIIGAAMATVFFAAGFTTLSLIATGLQEVMKEAVRRPDVLYVVTAEQISF